jgi:hypothetical protein
MSLSRSCRAVLAVAALGFGLAAPRADALTYGVLLSGTYVPPASFAELTVTGSGNVYDFSLSAFDLDALFTTDAFIGSIAVDLSPFTAALPTISNVVGDAPVDTSLGGGPTGVWDFRFLLAAGQDRLTANEDVSWRATFAEPVTFVGDQFTLHVQGLTLDQGNSAWYVPIPEPSTYAMLLAGLGLLGLMVRRRAR